MVKMIVLYKKPADTEAFDRYYFETHVPLTQKVPSQVKTEITRFTSAAGGEPPYYLMFEMYFNSKTEMDEALATPDGRATGKDLRNFTEPGSVTVAFAEVLE